MTRRHARVLAHRGNHQMRPDWCTGRPRRATRRGSACASKSAVTRPVARRTRGNLPNATTGNQSARCSISACGASRRQKPTASRSSGATARPSSCSRRRWRSSRRRRSRRHKTGTCGSPERGGLTTAREIRRGRRRRSAPPRRPAKRTSPRRCICFAHMPRGRARPRCYAWRRRRLPRRVHPSGRRRD